MTEPAASPDAMRILYVTQWFEPEPILKGTAFVRGLQVRGHEVETVTGFPNYPTGKVYPGYKISLHAEDVVEGVPVHRVALYANHDRSSVRRILNYFSFAFSAAAFGLLRARKFDVLYVYQPLPAALAAALVCAVRRRPFIMDVQDLWPDSVISSGMPGVRVMERVINMLCNFAYRRATRIVAQSRGIAAKLVERGVPPEKISVVFNWADEHAPQGLLDVSRYGFDGRFNIVYGGNLGRLQGLDSLIRAAVIANREVPELQLMLIGNGVEDDRLRALVAELGSDAVRVEPGVSREEIADVYAGADVLAMHLVDDPLFEITIPSKTQAYMAAGKPVLVGVRGEAGQLVTDAGAGVAVAPGDVDALASAMVGLARTPEAELAEMGRRGRAAFLQSFTFERIMDATAEAMRQARDAYAARRRR